MSTPGRMAPVGRAQKRKNRLNFFHIYFYNTQKSAILVL